MAFPIPTDSIETRHYINGSFQASSDGNTFELFSPFNHKKVTNVFEATIEDTNAAVAAAKAAFPTWSALRIEERAHFMKVLAPLITEATSTLAMLEAMSMGRPVNSYFDAMIATKELNHWAECGYEVQGTSSLNTPGVMTLALRQPVGPVAAIIPWNAPVALAVMKIAPALIAGCTVVLKSSEKSPLTSLKLAQLVHEAGFPPGVVNVLSGHGLPCGQTLAAHPDIRCVNFTGSTATGRQIQIEAAKSNLKRVVLELGGKSPAIIFDDAEIERAAGETAFGMSLFAGQACIANSRIYVQEAVLDRFVNAFTAVVSGLKKGDPLSSETTQGPLADSIQHARVKSYLDVAHAGKGEVVLGGKPAQVDGAGHFIDFTVLRNVPEDEKIVKEEIFGPVVVINSFKTEEEVLVKANDSEYGLQASVYTKDLDRALRMSKGLEAGTVLVNCTTPMRTDDAPFGGYKGSGQGREGYGYSLDAYLETKAVVINFGSAKGVI